MGDNRREVVATPDRRTDAAIVEAVGHEQALARNSIGKDLVKHAVKHTGSLPREGHSGAGVGPEPGAKKHGRTKDGRGNLRSS